VSSLILADSGCQRLVTKFFQIATNTWSKNPVTLRSVHMADMKRLALLGLRKGLFRLSTVAAEENCKGGRRVYHRKHKPGIHCMQHRIDSGRTQIAYNERARGVALSLRGKRKSKQIKVLARALLGSKSVYNRSGLANLADILMQC
jgi:hypothetical protein